MDCEVKFGTIPFWGRFCSACIMLLGGSITFLSVRLNVNGKPFQPTLKAESPATDVQHTQPAICAHLKVNHLCYVWGHRGKKVCVCCEKARKQQAGA